MSTTRITPEDAAKVAFSVEESLRGPLGAKLRFFFDVYQDRDRSYYRDDRDRLFYELFFQQLCERNGEQSIAVHLLGILAECPGAPSEAGTALRGTTDTETRQRISDGVESYLCGEELRIPNLSDRGCTMMNGYRFPLALGRGNPSKPPTYREVELLKDAVRYRHEKSSKHDQDIVFRCDAAESLATIEQDDCQSTLEEVFLSPQEDDRVRTACREGLSGERIAALSARYSWLEQLPQLAGLKRLSREGHGWLKACFMPPERFSRVRRDLLDIIGGIARSEDDCRYYLDSKMELASESRHIIPRDPSGPWQPYVVPWEASLKAKLRERGIKPYGKESPEDAAQAVEERDSLPSHPRIIKSAPPTSPTKTTPVVPATPAIGRQSGSERPITGSDEDDLKEDVGPAVGQGGFCNACLDELRGEGILSPEEYRNSSPVSASRCVRCSKAADDK